MARYLTHDQTDPMATRILRVQSALTMSGRLSETAGRCAGRVRCRRRSITRNWLRVCVSRRSKVAPCCALDEGRPLGAALQEEASNRHERLLPNGDGRERHGQKARLDRVRYGLRDSHI
jgi:hypothetical protein